MIETRERRPLIIAHRGFHLEYPENTARAFLKALEFDVDMVELDVRLTRDRVPVVFHDSTIDRLTSSSGPVAGFLVRELARIPIRRTMNIPTLEEVLSLLQGQVKINVEIKTLDTVLPTIRTIRMFKMQDEILISSFVPEALELIREIEPVLSTALLVRVFRAKHIHLAQKVGATRVHPNFRFLSKEDIAALHAAGLKVNTYTPNTLSMLREIAARGVDGVITDRPDVAREAFSR